MSARKVGGFTKIITVTPTIEAAAYVAGDLVGGKLSFSNVLRPIANADHTGLIQSIIITDLGTQSAALDLVLFDVDPTNTTFTENAAFDIDDTDLLTILGVAAITDWKAFNDNSVGLALNMAMPFNLGTNNTLYGALISRGTPTYASTTDLTVRIGVLQD